MRHSRLLAPLLALAAAGGSCAARVADPAAPTLQELVVRHTEARGGVEAVEAVARLEYTLVIEEPAFTVRGVYRVDRQGRMRIDIQADGVTVFTEAYDGERGWQWRDGAATPTAPDAEAALRHGPQLPMHILGFHELEGRGHRVERRPAERLDGVRYHVLRVILDDGFETDYYLDPQTFLVAIARDRRAFHSDLDPETKTLETRFSDYRRVGGVMKSYRSETREVETGRTSGTTIVESIRVNPPFDPSLFARP